MFGVPVKCQGRLLELKSQDVALISPYLSEALETRARARSLTRQKYAYSTDYGLGFFSELSGWISLSNRNILMRFPFFLISVKLSYE